MRHGNVVFADGNLFFNRSGMTISQTAEIIAEILHGVRFGASTEGQHWRRVESPVSSPSHSAMRSGISRAGLSR